jgi:DNA-binding MurR/RpiR family transcriptional regulator
LGIEVWSMTGPAPNPLAELSDHVICSGAASTAAVQELQLIAVHAICASLDAYLADNPHVAARGLTVVSGGRVA